MRAPQQGEALADMCPSCFAAFGSLAGVALVAKVGGLAGLKAGAGVLGAKLLMMLR